MGLDAQQHQQNVAGARATNGFYAIVGTAARRTVSSSKSSGVDEEKELAELQAVTAMQPDGPTMTGGFTGHSRGRQGQGTSRHGGPDGSRGPPKKNFPAQMPTPELLEQDNELLPKKRVTGIDFQDHSFGRDYIP